MGLQRVTFPAVKLLDFARRQDQVDNPFAVVVQAHLKALETRNAPVDRCRWKLWLVKSLYDRGWTADEIIGLFRFIDWIMDRTADLTEGFWREYRQFEEGKHMPFVTSVERIGLEKGRQEGRQEFLEALRVAIEKRFPEHAQELMTLLPPTAPAATLGQILAALVTAKSADEFRAAVVRLKF